MKIGCLLGAISLSMSACAAIISENEPVTYFETDPQGAVCDLNGQDFKRKITAPTSIHLPATAAPITVTCKAEGYLISSDVLDTPMEDRIVANVLFGVLISVHVEPAIQSGSGKAYPPRFMVLLQPETFQTVGARNEWFIRRSQQIKTRWEKAFTAIQNACMDERVAHCKASLDVAERKRDNEVNELEERRGHAVVRRPHSIIPGTTPAKPTIKPERLSPENLKNILGRHGYASSDEAVADYLKMADDENAKARFMTLPPVARDAIGSRAKAMQP